MTFDGLAAQFGPYIGLAIYIGWREMWPWLRDRLFPAWTQRQEQAQADARADRRAQQRAETALQERLFQIIEQNTRVLTGLEVTLERVVGQLTEQNHALGDLNEDMSGLYAHVGKRRPSRERAAAGPVKPE